MATVPARSRGSVREYCRTCKRQCQSYLATSSRTCNKQPYLQQKAVSATLAGLLGFIFEASGPSLIFLLELAKKTLALQSSNRATSLKHKTMKDSNGSPW